MADRETSAEIDSDEMLQAERDIRAALGDHPFDFVSMQAIANIYRAAAAIRRRAERTVLASSNLSWGGFTILYVLWVWGEMETNRLATECDLAKGTVTGLVTTLEKRQLVERERVEQDRRRVLVRLTPAGLDTIEELFPSFNRFEAQMSAGLDPAEKDQLSHLLRVVITNAGD